MKLRIYRNYLLRKLLGLKLANKIRFYFAHSYWGDFDKPKTFSEWINKYKINYTEEMVLLSDKILVKKWLVERGYSKYVIADLHLGLEVSNTTFSMLPKSFVMKLNTGAGSVLVVENKELISTDYLMGVITQWLGQDYVSEGCERHYSKIVENVLIEEFIDSEHSGGLVDYKFHCFPNGRIIVAVYSNRKEGLTTNYFDESWNECDLKWVCRPTAAQSYLKKPAEFTEALELVRSLYKDLGSEYVRIDLFMVQGRISFGEFTFTPGGGFVRFKSKKADESLGSNFVK